MKDQVVRYRRYTFQGNSGYIVDRELIGLGHTALVKPWHDPQVHKHEFSEEFYFLRKGVFTLLVTDFFITLQPNEILMVKPNVPQAIVGGKGEIEHFGVRVPLVDDKQVVGQLPQETKICYEGERLLSGEWGHRIPLNKPDHQNCWLVGAGSAKYASKHMALAYLDFLTTEEANAGIGRRHRLHLHQKSWEYYTVLEGTKNLRVENELVTIEAGGILEIPPNVKHTLQHRTAPFRGFTIRVPIVLNDKIEFETV